MNTDSLYIWTVRWWIVVLLTLFSAIAFAGGVTIDDCSTCAACDGSATATMEQPGDLSYLWTSYDGVELLFDENSDGTSTLDGLCPGIYFLSVIQENDTLSTFSFNVAVDGFDPGENTHYYTCVGSSNFSLISVLDGNPMPGGVWTDGSGNPVPSTFDPGSPGQSTFIYSVSTGTCEVYSELTITTNQNADPGTSTTYDICDHYEPFELIDVMSGQPEPNGVWLFQLTEEVSGTFVPGEDPEGIYTYMIDTVPGCGPVFSNINMDVHHYPNAGEDSTLNICIDGGPVILTDYLNGTPEEDGQWIDPLGEVTDSLVDPTVDIPGAYKYQIVGTPPCPVVQASITVNFEAEISAGENTSIEMCETGAPVDLFSILEGTPTEGGYWTNELGEVVSPTISPSDLSSSEFTYTVEAVGCNTESAEVEIQIEAAPEAGNGGFLSICEDQENIELESFLPTDVWIGNWWSADTLISDGQIHLGIGTHLLKYIVDGNMCSPDTAEYIVDVEPIVESHEDQIWNFCENEQEVNLEQYLEEPEYNIQFLDVETSTPATTFDPATGVGELFYCVYLSENACPNDTAIIEIQTDLIAFEDSTFTHAVCQSEEILYLNSVLAEEIVGLGSWSGNKGTNLNEISLNPGSYEFYYSSENGEACATSVLEMNLEVVEQLSAGADSLVSICSSDPVLDLESLRSGNAYLNGTWWMNDESLENLQFDPSNQSSVVIEYEVESEAPCVTSVAEYTINVFEEISFDAGENISLCSDQGPVQLGSDNENNYQYAWNPSPLLNQLNISDPLASFDGIENEYFQETLFVAIENGACEAVDSLQIEVFPIPEINVSDNLVLCEDDEFEIHVTGADEYVWTGDSQIDDPTQDTISGIATNDATFTVTGYNEYSCSATDMVETTVLDTPVVQVDVSTLSGCAPLSTEISYSALEGEISSLYWTINNDFHSVSETSSVLLDDSGSYMIAIHVTSQNGCSSTSSAADSVLVHPVPDADFIYTPEELSLLNPEVNYLNTSEGATIFEWDFGMAGISSDENPVIHYSEEEPGFYETCLGVENEFGCTDTICKTIEIEGLYSVFVPNAFSPNQDGINEVFQPILEGIDPTQFKMVIYDRWGEKVFETQDPTKPWIGNYKGGNHYVPADIYNWQMKVQNKYTGVPEILSGHITLLR